jgi:hypothetical protein
MRGVTAQLSGSSLDAAAKQVRAYANELEARAHALAVGLAADAADDARMGCPVDAGSLASSIAVSETASGADVTASGDHAAFVEFGTGLGAPPDSPASNRAAAAAGWARDASGRGADGWAFLASDGTWKTTHGQDGAGFMGHAADRARMELPRRAREEFAR